MISSDSVSHCLGISLLSLIYIIPSQAYELSGYSALEYRYFFESSPNTKQHHPSLVIEPELFFEFEQGQHSLVFSPFIRVDQHDSERSHTDIRELLWQWFEQDWELRVGISKVFWGVTESQHLVDVINQTDLVENIDGEDKLGQAMVNLSVLQPWGNVDFFLLPHFRERRFHSQAGRLGPELAIDTDRARYVSGAKPYHLDWAIRWHHSATDWDWALSHFYGVNREPELQLSTITNTLIPTYHLMHQSGLELQYTHTDWIWKLEMIRRESDNQTYTALTAGAELTLYQIADSQIDIGLLVEYLFDDRGDSSSVIFDNDILLATRLNFNNASSTELLLGTIVDGESAENVWYMELSHRVGNRYKLSVDARFFNSKTLNSGWYPLRDDHHINLQFARYF